MAYKKKDIPEGTPPPAEGVPPKKEKKAMKAKSARGPMTDQQKKQLKSHMDKLDMSPSEKKSHRMKMMARMRNGKSVKAAHKEIMA